MTVNLTVLIEDKPPPIVGLECEHGISFLLETGDGTILFDCGETDKAIHNARSLKAPLEKTEIIVLSHNHHDHAGGFPGMAGETGIRRLITGDSFFLPKYSLEENGAEYSGGGFDERFLSESRIEHRICRDRLQLGADCWAVGDYARTHPEERIPERFVVPDGDGFRHDPFAEEVCLAVRTGNAMTMLLGCAHPGVLNMADAVATRFGLPIRAVLGGSHLLEASEERIDATLAGLKRLGVVELGLCHCSGDAVMAMAAADPDFVCRRLGTGDRLELTRF